MSCKVQYKSLMQQLNSRLMNLVFCELMYANVVINFITIWKHVGNTIEEKSHIFSLLYMLVAVLNWDC